MLKTEIFVAKYWPHAKAWEEKTGLSAIFTIAQGAIESGWGKSSLGLHNNIFGITANAKYTGKKVLKLTTEEHATKDVKYQNIRSISWDEKKKRYIYTVERYFRSYDCIEDCFADRLKVLQQAHFGHAWPHRGDPYTYIKLLQGGKKVYATGSGYVTSLTLIIKQVERIVKKLELE